MPRPYSQDLRERAIALVAAGQSRRAVAQLLALAESTVIAWVKRHTETGSCAAKPMGGTRRAVLHPERAWLLARVAEEPDLTLRALRAELADRGLTASVDALWRFLRTENLTFKKNAARRRTGPTRCATQARALAASPGPGRP